MSEVKKCILFVSLLINPFHERNIMDKTKTEKDYNIFRLTQEITVEREIFLRVDKETKTKDLYKFFPLDDYESNKVFSYMGLDWDETDITDVDGSSCDIVVEDRYVLERRPYSVVCDVSLEKKLVDGKVYGMKDGMSLTTEDGTLLHFQR